MAMEVTDPAKALLAKRGFDPVLGARPLRRRSSGSSRTRWSEKILFERGGRARTGRRGRRGQLGRRRDLERTRCSRSPEPPSRPSRPNPTCLRPEPAATGGKPRGQITAHAERSARADRHYKRHSRLGDERVMRRGLRTHRPVAKRFAQMGAGFKSMFGGELQGMTKNLTESRNKAMSG